MNAYRTTNYLVNLIPLEAYEHDGGNYDDSGNGGERVSPCNFVAAIRVERRDDPGDANLLDAIDEIGLRTGSIWRDSTCGWMLLRDWPDSAPVAARCGLDGPSVASIAAAVSDGTQDIDLLDFARRLNLAEGWDWDDVDMLPGDAVSAAISAGLR